MGSTLLRTSIGHYRDTAALLDGRVVPELVQDWPSVGGHLAQLFARSRVVGMAESVEHADVLLRSVDAAARFAYEQGITRRRLTVTELFE